MTTANAEQIKIDASPQQVWKAITDFDSYPQWNPMTPAMKGQMAVGAKLKGMLELGPLKVPFFPKLLTIDEPHELAGRAAFPEPSLPITASSSKPHRAADRSSDIMRSSRERLLSKVRLRRPPTASTQSSTPPASSALNRTPDGGFGEGPATRGVKRWAFALPSRFNQLSVKSLAASLGVLGGWVVGSCSIGPTLVGQVRRSGG